MLLVWRGMPDYEFDSNIPQTTAISVIVPVRNEAANIFYLLEDLNRQDYKNFEVIIIDDNSEDDTVKIVQKFKKKAIFKLKVFSVDGSIAHSAKRPELLGSAGCRTQDAMRYALCAIRKGGKKNAIETGIRNASGELIVTTDGDCRLNPGWLSILQNFYISKAAKFISAPVSTDANPAFGGTNDTNYTNIRMNANDTNNDGYDGMFQKMQTIEFAGLIAIGAASIERKSPNMCNGANIAFPQKVFYEVNGYEGNKNVASGDDEFLMHKIFAHSAERMAHSAKRIEHSGERKVQGAECRGQSAERHAPCAMRHAHVYFLKNKEATVFTRPAKKLSAFIAQRMRWAGKWAHYADIKVKLLAIFIFTVNFCLIASIIFIIINQCCFAPPTGRAEGITQNAMPYALCAMLLKVFAEFVFLKTVMKFFSKRFKTLAFVLIELIHPFYVVFFGCLSNLGGFWWKGRKVR